MTRAEELLTRREIIREIELHLIDKELEGEIINKETIEEILKTLKN